MAPLQVPAEFLSCYDNRQNFPENMRAGANIYLSILESYKTRLDASSQNLFTSDANDIEVPIKDLSNIQSEDPNDPNTETQAISLRWPPDQTKRIHDAPKLSNFLGIQVQGTSSTFTRRDPSSRFMSVNIMHSISRF